MKLIKAIRGMNDVLAEDAIIISQIETTCAELLNNYAYQRIDTPIVEKTELFARSIGAETDIVSKEMYTFEDRNGDSLTLRPEGTACCVRAGIEHGLFYNQQQRLWYSGPMFRHERPQKGRYRQFRQIGVETYGWSTPDIDAELISLGNQLWENLGLTGIELQINSLGSSDSRKKFRSALVDYLGQYKDQLDADSQRRLDSNPLRILDSKIESTQNILNDAPILSDYLDSESKQEFEQLLGYLDTLGIDYSINTKLVRGLDYYNKTVFEWVYPSLGAQATICAGGRYDSLVEQLGGKPTPAIGFAMGVERLVELLKEQEKATAIKKPTIYLVSSSQEARNIAFNVVQKLRSANYSVQMHCGDGSFKNQIKRADKSGAICAVILGDDEVAQRKVTLKPLLSRDQQVTMALDDILPALEALLKS